MRYLVLSDLHANLEALEACLDAARDGYAAVLILGDVVGYGPNPNEVVDRVRALDPFAIVRGNHDKVAAGIDSAEGFNAMARAAARWTHRTLTAENRAWVADLPAGPIDVDATVAICHGSPGDEDAYIFDEMDALRAIQASPRPLCLYGHTHYPVAFEQDGRQLTALPVGDPDHVLGLRATTKYLVNPGSVGQPRDGDPRAAYAIVDTDTMQIEFRRVGYALDVTQGKITAAGLPPMLAARLAGGR